MKLLGLLLLLVLAPRGLPAQTTPPPTPPTTAPEDFTSGCSEAELKAILPTTDPAYSYAVDLARILSDRGFVVSCLCASKMASFFPGLVGAAFFDTDRGSFDVLFLPKGHVFHVKISERRENGSYRYTFRGAPAKHSPIVTADSGRLCYFVQHGNVMIPFLTSQEMATDLTAALSAH
jgi:hypothetical protein